MPRSFTIAAPCRTLAPDELSEPMSDDVLSIIPTDPQPDRAAAERAAALAAELAPGLPDGVEVEI